MDDDPPRFRERPSHCKSLELRAQFIKAKYAGLSVSSLQKAYYFAISTPPLSPPAISTATPTDVQTTTVKYMGPYLKERRLLDPLPSSWKFAEPPVPIDSLIIVEKSAIHFYDGDSAEIRLSNYDRAELLTLATHTNAIRIRMNYHDAPENKFAIRIYKQAQDSTIMQPFLTRHTGIESLRAIRRIAFQARTIYIHQRETTLPTDKYQRRLMDIFVETPTGSVENVAEILAREGYTLSFYATGISDKINERMRDAITNKRGLFSLPQDVFVYPYLPWDLRKLWPDVSVVPPPYTEYREIFNAPADPASAWRPEASPSIADDDDDDDDDDHENECSAESQQSDNFYFRAVQSKMLYESLCYKARSNILNAGDGLFIRPHGIIPKGSHLCLYSSQPTTEDEMNEARSTRDYAIQTANGWFDAEQENGNNLGRFSNQPDVLESLRTVKQLSQTSEHGCFFEQEWKAIEDTAREKCNAKYKTCSTGQLTVITAKELQPTHVPEEIYTYYGGLRTYWINAINRSPSRFPPEMREIVQWLLQSPQCNWTEEQRQKWSAM